MVAGRQDTGQDDGVDDTAGGLGSGHLENEGKGRSACVLRVEAGVVVGDVEADEENREDTGRALATCCRQQRQLGVVLEEENSPKDILHHLGHGLRRVLSLAGGNGDGFGTTIWKNSVSRMHRFCVVRRPAGHLQAKEAVTKTEAKPPMPPTKGAPGICQFSPPM